MHTLGSTNTTSRIALIMGTRPEVIKFAPLVLSLKRSKTIEPVIISSGQHRTMAEQAFRAFDLKPDLDLQLMTDDQTPNSFLSLLLSKLQDVLTTLKPNGVVVQGDTTTALGGALAAFHLQIPLAHLEAGLRTFRMDSPFPEEMNRCLVSKLAELHFCPTSRAQKNLQQEGIVQNTFLVGNTVVDAAKLIEQRLDQNTTEIESQVKTLDIAANKTVLVTGHRRENFDQPLRNLCSVLLRLRDSFSDIQIVYPVHLNPNVKTPVHELLDKQERIHLLRPVDYPSLLSLIKHSVLIISDSGGIQEEAPSFGTKVLVTRNTTERPEAIEAGCAVLTSLENPEQLFMQAHEELESPSAGFANTKNPFGEGTTAEQVRKILEQVWS